MFVLFQGVILSSAFCIAMMCINMFLGGLDRPGGLVLIVSGDKKVLGGKLICDNCRLF